jgi:hypothetical protein
LWNILRPRRLKDPLRHFQKKINIFIPRGISQEQTQEHDAINNKN